MPQLSPHIAETPHSGIRRMAELALAADSPIMLVGGDPNFATPDHIIDAAAAAARAGKTGYAAGGGLPPLLEAIVEKVRVRNGLEADVDQAVVTTGGCGGLFTTLLLLLTAGDELLVPDPGWSNYAPMAHVLHATAVGYRLDPQAGFTIDLDDLAARVTDRTRAILLNTPNNPTGTVESAERLRAVLDIAERHDLWVLSDECYDELVFGVPHVSTATLGGAERVITIFTFSKSYAMTGWRVGYVISPTPFARQLALHQEPVVSCAPTVCQYGALAALQGPQDCVTEMVAAYRERRDLAMAELDAQDVGYVRPDGSFFLMADVSAAGLPTWDFCTRLLDEESVGVVPGVAFGPAGEGYVRLSLASSSDNVREGARRLARFVRRLSAGD